MAPSRPAIREFYRDFVPPRYALKTVKRLLEFVPEKYLRGLDCVVLTNQSGHSRRDRIGKVTSRWRRVSQSRIAGRYHAAHKGNPAWIELFVDRISIRHPVLWFSPFRELLYGGVLFHEIGHHIDITMRPEYRDKEDIADSWKLRFTRAYFRKRYWYLVPVRKPLATALKALAAKI